jgi:signal transduction histidine kinase
LIGFLGLGTRTKGAYNERDVETLAAISTELTVAMQNAVYVQKIQNFNDALKIEVDRATAELRASNQKLKQLDQTKDEFISLTSHQLRTPLTTIKGYISMILDGDVGEVSPQQRKLLEEAFNSSQRMVHLISDFLNISRIQTGKFVIELTDMNLADILDEEIDQLRISATSRKLNLVYDKPSDFPTMPIDEGKIRQVMMNFIDNAIYYSPAGKTITVVLTHTATTVEFKVIDQGIGVPKAEQHKLFAKFSRASNARKQRPDGTGIGLFMAKKVVVALGGAIIFQSEEGKGSTFGFRLNRP